MFIRGRRCGASLGGSKVPKMGEWGLASTLRVTRAEARLTVYRALANTGAQVNPVPRESRLFGTLTSFDMFLVDKTLLI